MSRHTILVVEDMETTRRVICRLLETAGYQVLEAPDATLALYLITEHQPALTLLDIHLPGMSGLDVAALIAGYPFAILTADPDHALYQKARQLGALAYFCKPPQEIDFLRQIELVIEQSQKADSLHRAIRETRDVAKAIGVLMGVLAISEQSAFERLRAQSTRSRTRVITLAEQLLQTVDQCAGDPARLVAAVTRFMAD